MSDTTQYCTFWVGDLHLGVDVHRVQEVMRTLPVTRVPLAPSSVVGLMNLRGQIVTAIDLRHRLGLTERPQDQSPMNVVLRTEEAAVSLVVDRIGDVIEVHRSSYEAVPNTMKPEAREWICGVHKLDHQLLLILDGHQITSLDPSASHLSS